MLWFVLSFIGAISDAGYYICVKKYVQIYNQQLLAAGMFLCTGIVLLVTSSIIGFPIIGNDFIFAVLVSCFLGSITIFLTFTALKDTDISLAVPMISFTPLFLIITAFLFLHEIPSTMGVIGIIIIVAGSYVLNLSSHHTKLSDPLRSILSNRGVLLMVLVSFIYAVAINFDKIVATNSDPVFGSGIESLILGLICVGFFFVNTKIKCHSTEISIEPVKKQLFPGEVPWLHFLAICILIGGILSISSVSIMTAFTMQIVPYVIAIKRMSIIVIVLYGSFVFREKEVFLRLSGATLMVIGAGIVVTFS